MRAPRGLLTTRSLEAHRVVLGFLGFWGFCCFGFGVFGGFGGLVFWCFGGLGFLGFWGFWVQSSGLKALGFRVVDGCLKGLIVFHSAFYKQGFRVL